jgi:hypothetical protein
MLAIVIIHRGATVAQLGRSIKHRADISAAAISPASLAWGACRPFYILKDVCIDTKKLATGYLLRAMIGYNDICRRNGYPK